MTPSGIEPSTFRFVAQYLNQCATAVPGKRSTGRKSCPNANFSTIDLTMDCIGIELGPTRWDTGAKPASCRGLTHTRLFATAHSKADTKHMKSTARPVAIGCHIHVQARRYTYGIFKSSFTGPFLPTTTDFIHSYGCSYENAVLLSCHSEPQL
jgi:hypothetical protein